MSRSRASPKSVVVFSTARLTFLMRDLFLLGRRTLSLGVAPFGVPNSESASWRQAEVGVLAGGDEVARNGLVGVGSRY